MAKKPKKPRRIEEVTTTDPDETRAPDGGDGDDATPAAKDPRWATKDEFWFKKPVGAPVHEKIVTYGKWLRTLYQAAHNHDRMYERLYEGTEIRRHRQALAELSERGFSAARLNVSESIIDTLVSRQAKERPMPSFVVNDADWSLKRKARQYRKFIVGEMLETEYDALSRAALVDSTVIGTGITRIDDTGDGDCVFAERVLREEVLFDPRECKYGKPPNGFRIHRIARDQLIEVYPAFAKQIITADAAEVRQHENIDDDTTRSMDLDNYVDVYEGWHLPHDEDGDDEDGRHVLCLNNATLLNEVWHEPRFPLALLRFKRPRRGIWAKGLMFKLKDIQHRINSIVRDLQMNLQATGRGFYLQQAGTQLPPEMLTGWQPFTMTYNGNRPPTWTAPQPFSPAQLNSLEVFIRYAHDISGVSQAAAQSRSSLGPGASGVALDTQYDIDSERFAQQQAEYADYRLFCAQLYIDASKRVARKRKENEGKKKSTVYVSRWIHRDAIEQLEYDQVSLNTDQYKLQLEPVNFIPDTKGGKLSAVGQLAQAGIIPHWLVAALFDEPDLLRANRITLGAYWNAERKMEVIADEAKDMPTPEQYNDLDLEILMTKAYLNNAEAENAPDVVLERYRDYLSLVTAAIKTRAASAPPPGMGAGPAQPMMPGAAPMLPPGAPMPAGGAPPGAAPAPPPPMAA